MYLFVNPSLTMTLYTFIFLGLQSHISTPWHIMEVFSSSCTSTLQVSSFHHTIQILAHLAGWHRFLQIQAEGPSERRPGVCWDTLQSCQGCQNFLIINKHYWNFISAFDIEKYRQTSSCLEIWDNAVVKFSCPWYSITSSLDNWTICDTNVL